MSKNNKKKKKKTQNNRNHSILGQIIDLMTLGKITDQAWCVEEWSLTFWAPKTGFVEDNFSTDWFGGGGGGDDFWMIQVHHSFLCTLFLLVLHCDI